MAGTFPFGQPSAARPPRHPAGAADVFILGVYPSALHVAWQLPAWHAPGARVAAMAVDVEPTVFWDGVDPDPAALIERWHSEVGFVDGDEPGCDGHVAGVRLNGSSGVIVRDRILAPLGFTFDQTWLTDVVPWFFVKHGTAGRREQGDVVADVYNPFAAARGRPLAELPRRPAPADLIRRAGQGEAERLRRELADSSANIVFTLGDEARAVLASIADHVDGPAAGRLSVTGYGAENSVTVSGRRLRWFALVHPGQRAARWTNVHDEWAAAWAG